MARKKKLTTKNCFSPETIEQFRSLLMKELQKLSQRVSRAHQNLQSNRGAGEESADIGSDEFIRETGYVILGEDADTLHMIQAALKGIEDDTYGICQDCGQPISEIRLWAKPYAKYCIDCKSLREENGNLGPNER